MTCSILRVALAGAVVVAGSALRADEPVLPAPRPVAPPVVIPPSFERPNPYAVWQNYAVDRSGRWKPMAAPSPDGLRYVANGEPYPWWKEHQRYFQPVMANPAVFGGAPDRVILMPAPPPPAVTPAGAWDRMPYAED